MTFHYYSVYTHADAGVQGVSCCPTMEAMFTAGTAMALAIIHAKATLRIPVEDTIRSASTSLATAVHQL